MAIEKAEARRIPSRVETHSVEDRDRIQPVRYIAGIAVKKEQSTAGVITRNEPAV